MTPPPPDLAQDLPSQGGAPLIGWKPFAALTVICIVGGIGFNALPLLLIPAALLAFAWAAVESRTQLLLLYLLFTLLPFSTEVQFSDALGTDLPTEPLMIILAGLVVWRALARPAEVRLDHAFDLLLLVHWVWIAATAFFAEVPLIAWKFLIAKSWYILAFYAMARFQLNRPEHWRRAMGLMFVSLAITHAIMLVRFQGYGFAFAEVNRVMQPFYRNHVTFAALAVVVLPYGWFLFRSADPRGWKKWALLLMVLVVLAGVQFSYTRAAYVALLGGILIVPIVRWRLMRPALFASLLGATALVVWLVRDNRYLDFAPDFNKTVSHFEFEDLINATYKLQDISTMERVYRWVAGFRMVDARPVQGFGPNNFYANYERFTVTGFQTWVSDNPDHSGIHNYYLMTAVEQGLPGLAIYLVLIVFVMLYAEKVYHRARLPVHRSLVMTAISSLVVIHLLQTMNDLVETDKVGPFFFLAMALIVSVDRWERQERPAAAPPEGPGTPRSDAG